MQAETLKRSSQKTDTMQLIGLQGDASAEALSDKLITVPGISEVSIDMDTQKATITYDTAQQNFKSIQQAIQGAGFDALKPVHGEDGNCCGGCGG